MNPLIDRRAVAALCASLVLLLCTFNLSCSSNPCAPVFHAGEKLKDTPYHIFGSAEQPDGTEITGEYIRISGTGYSKDQDQWIIDDSPDERLDRLLQDLRRAANVSCHLESTEFIDGEAADYYLTQGKGEGFAIQGRFWVSKSTGLILRVNTKEEAGDFASGSASVRYQYTNVTAPIISK